ncbi:MAG: hypothetical protein ABIN58_04735 [candidate division WOR-3 bacterium]
MRRKIIFLPLFLCVTFSAVASIFAQEDPVYSREGNVPILLTAPHAGRPDRLLPNVPVRSGKDVRTRWDINTDIITKLTAEHLEKKYHIVPYVVMAKFSRKSVDVNREANKAYETPAAKPIYDQYHGTVRNYVVQIKRLFGSGILLDIHGQELKNDVIWRGTRHGETIRNLLQTHGWSALVREDGILGFLQSRGYRIYPNGVEDSEVPYEGGYTVSTYGSDAGGIDALQLEIGGSFRLRAAACQKFSEDFASAIHHFYLRVLKK